MPIPENVARVHLNWTLGTEEIAVSTFHMQLQHGAGNTLDWDEASNTLATKIAAKWASNVGPKRLLFGASVALSNVSTYHLDAATGHTLNKGLAVATGDSSFTGGGTPSLPWECAVAVSLYAYAPGTFVPNRASLRGRFYLPPLASTAMGGGVRGGRLELQPWTDLTAAMGAFCNDIHHTSADAGDNPLGGEDWWSLGVLSRKRGEFHHATTVRVGDVPDVQRRRRNSEREEYQSAAISDD